MSNKLVKVINNKDRYFNWARKGWILEVDKNRLSYYLQNWFSEVKEIETKENIVKKDVDTRTAKELKEILDHNGVEYEKKAKKSILEVLVKEIETKENTSDNEDNSTNEVLKAKLIEEAIVSTEDLEWKTDAEIEQIAKDNWLI